MTGRRVTRLRLTWQLVAAFGAVTTAAYPFLSVLAQNVAYDALGLLCVLAVGVGLFRYRPSRPAPWLLLGLGVLLWVLGDLAYSWQDLQPGDPPFPAVADLLYLGGYPAMAAGLALSVRRTGARDGAAWQDASILALAASVLVWETLLQPVVEEPGTSVVARSVALGYPVMGLVLLLLVLRLVHGRGRRPGPCGVLALALALYLVSDMAYGLQVVRGTYETGGAVDLGWLLSYAVLGTLALHPSMVYIAHPAPAGPLRRSRLRLIGLSSAALVAPCTLAQRHLVGDTDDVLPFAIASSVLFLLVSLRSSGLIVELESLTGELRGREGELERRATTDALTGLANRRVLSGRLEQDARAGRRSCVALLDLDDFKHFNDSRGHTFGDTVLKSVAERLTLSLREGDTLARWGGDEFVLLLPDLSGPQEAAGIVERLLATFRNPLMLGGQAVHVGVSLGIDLYPSGAARAEELIRHADIALYRAKADRCGYQMFTEAMNERVQARLALESDLRAALEQQALTLHYQPRINLADGQITSMEALARWYHPVRGWIAPAIFIPLAEETGLIEQLGDLVLDLACAQAKAWQEAGFPTRVAVNVSAEQLRNPGFVDVVQRMLGRHGLDPALLELEITESTAMADIEGGIAKLQQVRESGIYLAIDDFGTAYSSLAYLKRLPVHSLKIDQAFVKGLGDFDATGEARIVQAIVALGRSFGLTVVAEGVETEAQRLALWALGCDEAQGYLFARPLPSGEVMELLAQDPNTVASLAAHPI